MNISNLPRAWQPALQWSLIVPLLLGLQTAQPATTDLADVPLFTSSASAVKPNIMFILDDSGSMANDYLPDEAGFSTSKYGRLSAQCNGLAYNSRTVYSPPVNSVGVSAAAGSTTFLSTNPNTRVTSGVRTLSTGSIAIVDAGTITVTFPASPAPANGWYSNGDLVTVFSTTDTANFMEGTVTGWSAATATLTIGVAAAVGTGNTISNLRIGNGVQPYYWKYKGAEPALSYAYTSSGVITGTTFYRECNSTVGSSPGSGAFDRIAVSSASTDAQNYANWYAYYRTRMSMMKASVSLAFKDIGDRYRVGYSTIRKTNTTASTDFLDIDTFNQTQKDAFYTSLNSATPSSFTPLRGALSKAGQYFANKAPGQTKDPVQYSCQKNFTILSTDGYWNTSTETASYGPFGVTGASVGQQDGAENPFPIRDGANAVTTTVTRWDDTRRQVTLTGTKVTAYTGAQITTTTRYGAGTGVRTDTYSGYLTNSTVARCGGGSPCTITITTAAAHGLLVGNQVTIVGATPTAYNGTRTVTAVLSPTQYTFSLATRPASNSVRGFTMRTGACPSGQGEVTRARTQTDTYPGSRAAVTTATQTDTTSYTQNERATVTPYTQTVVVTNGATTSDTTATGTAVVTNTAQTPPADDVVASAYSSSPTTTTAPNAVVVTNLGTSTVCSTTVTNGSSAASPVSSTPADAVTVVATTIAPVTAPAVTTTVSDTTVGGTRTSVATDTSTGGIADTLADVAAYYYKTDLRTTALGNCAGALGAGTNVCQTTDIANNATNVGQNMLTFTLGLGVSGTLKFTPDYLTNPRNSDYFGLTQGTKRWPNPTFSTGGGDPTNIDDLWHAAVNGRGQYFSAGDPTSVVNSLQSALRKITEIRGSAAAAATSTLQPVDGDNDIFVAEFTSGKWIGDVRKFSISPSTGLVSTTPAWSAGDVLNARVADLVNGVVGAVERKIYYFQPATGSTGTLREFTYANLLADSLNGNFDNFCSKPGSGGGAAPAQCATLSVADLATANAGTNLVTYLRGRPNSVYRPREGVLGDIINSSPLYVGAPKFKYTENSYASFASSKASRAGVLYVGSNAGMLHAFDRATGSEKWTYVPSDALPGLYKLADTDYTFNHQFYVDGSPQVGDVWDGAKWRTIIVGGLNKGGRMYYALDVTDPENPVALWEFRASQLGLTFGNPVITKRKDGTWVVVFGSGYNNVGDGNGRLFVVDAVTGAQLMTPVQTYTTGSTPAGSAGTPSGLAKINAFIESEIDNTAKVFYGGDLLGNVWRFDIDSNVAPFGQAMLLANLSVAGTPQPITTKPEIAEVNYNGSKYNVIYVGTGRYLGTGDLSNADLQSVYALKDELTTTGLGDARGSGALVEQTISDSTGAAGNVIRKASTNAVNWQTKSGWLVDLPSAGERVNVNMVLALNVLSVATNVPTSDVCDAGGRSWLYKFDIGTGSAVSNATDMAVAIPLGNVLVAGQTVVQLPDGRTVTISTLSDTSLRTDSQPPPPPAGLLRRSSWRELAN